MKTYRNTLSDTLKKPDLPSSKQIVAKRIRVEGPPYFAKHHG